MSIKIHLLNASGRFSFAASALDAYAQQAVRQVRALLPVGTVDIVLFDPQDDPGGALAVKNEMRMGGMCYGPSLVLIPVYAFGLTAAHRRDQLLATLAHELYHAVRIQALGSVTTLKDALIHEGLAGHFEAEVTGQVRAEYYCSLTPGQLASLRTRARLSYGSTHDVYGQWFLGQESAIPLWAGYALGYSLVSDYLATHPQEKASTLYNRRAWEFAG